MKGKYLPQITLKRSQPSPQIPENLSQLAIYSGLMPVTVQNATLYFHLLYWHFFLVFHQKNVFVNSNPFF